MGRTGRCRYHWYVSEKGLHRHFVCSTAGEVALASFAPPSRPPPAPFAFSHRAALARRFPYVSVPLRRHAFLSCCLRRRRRRRRLSSSTAASSLICHCRGPSHLFPEYFMLFMLIWIWYKARFALPCGKAPYQAVTLKLTCLVLFICVPGPGIKSFHAHVSCTRWLLEIALKKRNGDQLSSPSWQNILSARENLHLLTML
ncbi:hypothetical protein GW17_00055203 [Ensete ventricosum]|nr:hypothetical protein GW17_00055203 [Ensete ventricosum]